MRRTCGVGPRGALPLRTQRYKGRITAHSWPRRASASGSEPATSANPPVLAKPTTSEAASKTRIAHPRLLRLPRYFAHPENTLLDGPAGRQSVALAQLRDGARNSYQESIRAG